MSASSEIRSKSISAFFWDLSGNIGNQIIAFIISVILARLLAPAEFGLIAMVNIVFLFSNLLLDVGLGSALIQRKHLLPIHYSSVFYFNVSIGLLLTTITFFAAPLIAHFYQQPTLTPLIQVMSISFMISAATIIQNIKLRKNLNFKHRSIARFTSNIISGVTGITMAYTGYGVWSLLTQQLLNKVIFSTILWITGKWLPQLAFSFKALKQLWYFGINIFFTKFLNIVFTKLDIIIIGKLFPISTLGHYQRGLSLNNLVIQFSTNSLIQVLFPLFSDIQNDLERIKKIIYKASSVLALIVFFIIGLGYLCSEEFILILFTKKWLPAAPYFKLLLIASFATPLSALFINVIVGRGNARSNLHLSLFKKIPQGLNLLIGFLWGIEGFLYGLIIVAIIGFILNVYFTKKELNTSFTWLFKPFLSPLILSAFIVLLVILFINIVAISNVYVLLLSKGIIFSLLYAGLAYIFKLSSLRMLIEEIKLQKNKRK